MWGLLYLHYSGELIAKVLTHAYKWVTHVEISLSPLSCESRFGYINELHLHTILIRYQKNTPSTLFYQKNLSKSQRNKRQGLSLPMAQKFPLNIFQRSKMKDFKVTCLPLINNVSGWQIFDQVRIPIRRRWLSEIIC